MTNRGSEGTGYRTGRCAAKADLRSSEPTTEPVTELRTPERRVPPDDVEIDAFLQAMTVETQTKTLASVERTKKKLEETVSVADATTAVLERQHEQMDAICDDLESAKARVQTADRNFNEYEKWRLFGGKSNKRAHRAEQRFSEDDARRDARRERRTASYWGRRPASSPKVPASRQPIEFRCVTDGLVGRDEAECAALGDIAANDARVNAGLADVSKLVDRVEDRALTMHRAMAHQHSDLAHLSGQVTDVGRGLARINERANYNVRRAGA